MSSQILAFHIWQNFRGTKQFRGIPPGNIPFIVTNDTCSNNVLHKNYCTTDRPTDGQTNNSIKMMQKNTHTHKDHTFRVELLGGHNNSLMLAG